MLHDLRLTRHAEVRMRQRGLREGDVNLLLESASQISPDVYLLTRQDAAEAIARCKRRIQRLERPKGCKIVVAEGTVVTCYHSGHKNQKKTLRHGRAVR